MIVFPNAKINLGLQIIGKRTDGYHLLRTIFYPIPLRDSLELVERTDGREADTLEVRGDESISSENDNLVLRAVHALRSRYDFPYLELYLQKAIPSGAGMGGGSADATFTLKAVRDCFELSTTDAELEEIALSLGADCPFFVRNTPALGEGIGEVLTPLEHNPLERRVLVVVKPNLHISTARAFAGLGALQSDQEDIYSLIQLPLNEWEGRLVNDFERSLFPEYPILATLKQRLYDLGAVYASMTGSGAALYGIFDREVEGLSNLFTDCFVWQSRV